MPNGVVVLGHGIEVAGIRFAANQSARLEFAFGTPRDFVVIEVGLALAVSRDEGMRELEEIVPEGNWIVSEISQWNETRRRERPLQASGLNDAFAFFDGVDLVDGGDLKGFLCAARPEDFDAIDCFGPAEAEVQALVGA